MSRNFAVIDTRSCSGGVQKMPNVFNLAENLESYNVNGWNVKSRIQNKPSSGGNFSVGYLVENDAGVSGFMKVLDYSRALASPNSASELQAMTSAYIFERDLLRKCNKHKLRYVVRIIDAGHYSLPQDLYPEGVYTATAIDYLVLEKADNSVRSMIDLSRAFDYAWALRSLHNVAVGINEMHSIQVAHQDIKPSNILLFDNNKLSKLGDVGRASSLEKPAVHDNYKWAGDSFYTPFELLYGEINSDWKVRRFSCDMFMFGNLIMTYFNNISITAAVLNRLPKEMQPGVWTDTYQTILPVIQKEFAECVEYFNTEVDIKLRDELMLMIRQMCNPNVSLRGDQKSVALGTQQYSLQKYISRLDYWARKYEFSMEKVFQ